MKYADVKIMKEAIQFIEQMLQNNAFDKNVLLNILDNMSFMPIIPIKIPKGNKVLRSSTNNEHKFHKTVSRLSYPPVEKAKTDRTSLVKQPMFYASVFTSAAQSENAYPRIFSAFETADILRSYNKQGKVIITQSVWENQADIYTFAFPYPKSMPHACNEIKAIQKLWDVMKSEYTQEKVEFMEYIGEIMTRKSYSCLYEITANIVDYILSYGRFMDRPLDGIYYPSVWSNGAGVNICLKPSVVDRYLRFVDAKLVLIDKNIGEATLPFLATSKLDGKGVLQWTPTQYTLKIIKEVNGFSNLWAFDDMMFASY